MKLNIPKLVPHQLIEKQSNQIVQVMLKNKLSLNTMGRYQLFPV